MPLVATPSRRALVSLGPFSLAHDGRRPPRWQEPFADPLVVDQALPDHWRPRARGDRVGRRPLKPRLYPVRVKNVDQGGAGHRYRVPTTHAETVLCHDFCHRYVSALLSHVMDVSSIAS